MPCCILTRNSCKNDYPQWEIVPITLHDAAKEIPSGRPYRRTKPFAQVRLEILAQFALKPAKAAPVRISSTGHLDSRMYCWPALCVRFRLAQNFSGHLSNVAFAAEDIVDEV